MGLASLTFELRDLLGSVQHRVVLTLSESEYRRALTLPSSPCPPPVSEYPQRENM